MCATAALDSLWKIQADGLVKKALQKGLLMFAPVRLGAATVKVCPPLVIEGDAARDGLAALAEARRALSN